MIADGRIVRALAGDARAVALLEFALGLPVLIGFTLGGLEMTNYVVANNTVQRLATMSADMLSQAGLNDVQTTEANIYDMFYSLDVSAQPLDMRNRGRMVLTVVKGVSQSDGTVRNEFADAHIYSQQFDGGYTTAAPILGCHSTVTLPSYPRTLPAGEIMVHSQVSYLYQPLIVQAATLSYFKVPTTITRTAVFRMRKNRFNITNDGSHPVKNNCTSANGL